MANIIEIFADTGQVIERDFTPEELEQREKDIATAEQAAADALAAQQAKEEARVAAINHAKSLGFTDEMIAVMYPGLGGM